MAKPSHKEEPQQTLGAQVREATTRSNQALLLVDGSNLKILDVNDACYTTLGYPVEILLGLRLTDLLAEKDQVRINKTVAALSDGSAWSHRILCELQRSDQSTLAISLSIEIDTDPKSRRTKFLVSLSEVAESEQLYLSMETALAAANISFSNWTLNSEALIPWQGHDSSPAVPTHRRTEAGAFLSKLDPITRRETLALLSAVSSGHLTSIDTTVTTTEADGSTRWQHLTGVVPAHKPGTLLALRRDVTEAHHLNEAQEDRERALSQVQNQLQRSETELQKLLGLVPDFVVRLDSRAVIKYASPSFISDCDREDKNIAGASLISVLSLDMRTAFSEALGCLSDSVQMHEFVSQDSRTGKERNVWWTLLKMDEESPEKGVLCLGRDVTESTRARRQLERQAKQLRRSTATLQNFTSIVSHDLQAPMRHIANFTEMLEMQLGEASKENQTCIDILKSSTDKLQEMTTNLLEYSRLGLQYERMSLQPVAELIASAFDTLDESMKTSKARVEMRQLPELWVDPLLMPQLFQNLLDNSIKYCQPGKRPEVQISAERDNDSWILYWTDAGIGIDPKDKDRIFKIFTRLHAEDSAYEGAGVGLALCKRIVESHGGDIWLDTRHKPGTRLAMKFPIITEDERKTLK